MTPHLPQSAATLPPVNAAAKIWLVDLGRSARDLLEIERDVPRLSDDDAVRAERHDSAPVGAVIAGSSAACSPLSAIPHQRRATYIALRLVLERAFGSAVRRVPFDRSASGRPSLAGLSGDFSLSHVNGYALVATVRTGSVGVDCERPRPVRMSPYRRSRIEAAARHLAPRQSISDDDDVRFLNAWVRLEAFAKARQIGLGRVLTAIGAMGGRAGAEPAIERAVGRDDWAMALHGCGASASGSAGALPFHVADLALPAGLTGAWAWSADRAVSSGSIGAATTRMLASSAIDTAAPPVMRLPSSALDLAQPALWPCAPVDR